MSQLFVLCSATITSGRDFQPSQKDPRTWRNRPQGSLCDLLPKLDFTRASLDTSTRFVGYDPAGENATVAFGRCGARSSTDLATSHSELASIGRAGSGNLLFADLRARETMTFG